MASSPLLKTFSLLIYLLICRFVRATCLVRLNLQVRMGNKLAGFLQHSRLLLPPPPPQKKIWRARPPFFFSLGLVTIFILYSCVFTYLTEETFDGSVTCSAELRHLFAELWRVTISSVMSIRLSVCICQFGSHRTDFRGTWHWGL